MSEHIIQIPGSYYCHRDFEMTFCGDTNGITLLLGHSKEIVFGN